MLRHENRPSVAALLKQSGCPTLGTGVNTLCFHALHRSSGERGPCACTIAPHHSPGGLLTRAYNTRPV